MSRKVAALFLLVASALGLWWLREVEPALSEVSSPGEASDGAAVESSPLPVLSAREPLLRESPADSEPGLRLRVLTATKRTDGDPVGGIRVAVDVGYLGEEAGNPLFEGTTGRNGLLDLELPWSELEAFAGERGARLFGTPLSEGYQTFRSPEFLPESPPDDVVQLVVVLRPGGTVRGTLLDTAGCPTRGRIRAELPGRRSVRSANAREDGSFALHLGESGRYVVLASDEDGPGPGTAVLGPRVIDLAHPPHLDLRLVGPGRLRGQILDAGGLPAAGLELLARVQAADAAAGGSPVAPQDVGRRLEREGAGLQSRTGRTDAEGRFDFRGLRDDLYVVRARTDERSTGYPHLLTPVAVESDGSELHLRFDRPYLVVRIVDPEGYPVDVRPVSRYRFLDDWPDEPVVLVLRAPEDAKTSEARWLNGSGVVASVGVLAYDLPVPADWTVLLLGPGCLPLSQRVRLRKDSGRVECELVLADPDPMGTLVIDVVDADGLSVRDGIRARVLDPATEACLIESGYSYDDRWPLELDVAVGEYTLLVEGVHSVSMHHGYLTKSRVYGGCRQAVSVRPGERVGVTAHLEAPARLDLELEGRVTEADGTAFRAGFEEPPQDFVDRFAKRAEVLLWPPSGYPVEVRFAEEAYQGSTASGTHLFSSLTIGTRATSEALTPGIYRLEVRMPGGREASREVVLVPLRTLHVRFDLGGG